MVEQFLQCNKYNNKGTEFPEPQQQLYVPDAMTATQGDH